MSEIRHPLTEWRIGGFRSIRETTKLQLAGLNVLVGANSAGKSSVLHSMLLTAQTLGNPLSERTLMLNGPLVRLGLADDTVHEGSDGIARIGFGFAPEWTRHHNPYLAEFSRLNVAADFTPSKRGAEFEVVRSCVEAKLADEDGEWLAIDMEAQTEKAAREALQKQQLSRDRARRASRSLKMYAVRGTVPSGTAGATLRQFLPSQLQVVVNEHEEALQALVGRRWWRTASGRIIRNPYSTARANIPGPTRQILKTFLRETHDPEVAAEIPIRGRFTPEQLLDSLPGEAQEAVRQLMLDPWLEDNRHRLPFRGELSQSDLPGSLGELLDATRQWFQLRVRHLGPLRAEPQPLYGLPEAASGTSVGRSGEYTASVLSAYGARHVECPAPNSREVLRLPLGEAVNLWMTALGLLSSVRSQERGKLGYELHLAMEGVERDLDLTSVGVGVSQALPVVVLGLINPPGALLLFEQPELHLHPDVQASLGDFFLALADSGRQLIVETHSEYMVNRLRLRAATAEVGLVEELVRVFFFERSRGAARVSPGRIRTGGAIPDWPSGFLDTAAREVQALADAYRRSHGAHSR